MPRENDIEYFASPVEFRNWLAVNHRSEKELWVGYYKKKTGIPSMTWEESVDEALCFGWIDGLRKSVDEERYRIRFTPRRATSNWSAVNIKRVGELTRLGKMQPSGMAAFEMRKSSSSNQYSFEQNRDKVRLTGAYEKALKENKRAWEYFQGLAPSYKRMSIWWIMSAKREETRLRRLDVLIQSSAMEERIPQLRR